MKLESLEKLFVHELKDLHSAESQMIEALPEMIEAANDEGLKKAFRAHLDETRKQRSRIEKIMEGTEFSPRGSRCKGMEGLIEEGSDIIKKRNIEPDVLDAALIAAAQRIEHYEMAGYGVARTYAEKLGRYDAAELLQKTLEEEGAADRELSRLAERRINFEAVVA